MLYCHVYWCSILCFFFKQKTAYEMRISDWSSDVCSSDLYAVIEYRFSDWSGAQNRARLYAAKGLGKYVSQNLAYEFKRQKYLLEIGRASCRERVCQYV